MVPEMTEKELTDMRGRKIVAEDYRANRLRHLKGKRSLTVAEALELAKLMER